MMVEQQQHNSIAPMQSQHHQQPFIVPKTTTTASVIDRTTMTSHFQDYYGNEGSDENGDIVINVESETTTIKKVLLFCILSTSLLLVLTNCLSSYTYINIFLHINVACML